MLPFYGMYSAPWKSNISERIRITCINLENLLNQLDPQGVYIQHLASLKQALFHSHTKVVQFAVNQLIRLANDKQLAEKLTGDMEVVLGLIENLAHKDLRVARNCVKLLVLLSCTPKAIMNLLCPDITEVLKTMMTYVAVRVLVYEFIMQLSINSPIGLEKTYSCGILEDVINDFKKKESYMTTVHYHQLFSLGATSHGHSYLVKYEAVDTVPRQAPDISAEASTHLVTVVPLAIPGTDPTNTKPSQVNNKEDKLNLTKQKDEQKLENTDSKDVPTSLKPHKDFTESTDNKLSSCSVSKDVERSFTPPPPASNNSAPTSHLYSISDLYTAVEQLVGEMERVPPHEVLSARPEALDTALRALASSDIHTAVLALQLVAHVSSTLYGKRLLYKLGKRKRFMTLVMKKLLSVMGNSLTEIKTRALSVLLTLINGETKCEKINRKWFRQMGNPQEVLDVVVSLIKQQPEETKMGAYRVVQALCAQQWGQHYIRTRPDLLDLLLIDPADESRSITQIKYTSLKFLGVSPARKMLTQHTLKRIHNYLHKYKNQF